MGYEFAKGEATIKSVVKGDTFEEVENRLKNLMGYDDEARGRFIGHGLGLELDELPILGPVDETILKGNMTFSIEIITIIPKFGAIKIKEDVIVKTRGCEILSRIERNPLRLIEHKSGILI
jgi:Xaa-Pro aminopeptidase